MPNYDNIAVNQSGTTQAKLRKNVAKFRMESAPTLRSFSQGKGRTESATLAGMRIPFAGALPHGSTALDPYFGVTSFNQYIPSDTGQMFAGLAFMGFTLQTEWFHEKDMATGASTYSKADLKNNVMMNYTIEKNRFCIGDDAASGSLAVVTAVAGVGGVDITFAYDNNARNRTKGSSWLKVSSANAATDANLRILYQSYNPTTDALTAEFWLSAKPSFVTGTAVIISGAIGAGDVVVMKGYYKKVPYGIGYHSNPNMTEYQGANATTSAFLRPTGIDAADAPVSPLLLHSAKGTMMTNANDVNARFSKAAHMTIAMKNELAALDYDLRAPKRGEYMGTSGIGFDYTDGDTSFILDSNYIESEIDIIDHDQYFEYRQRPLDEVTKNAQQYVGVNLVGSTEFYQNWGESYNLIWDGRGDDGKKGSGGQPNSAVRIYNIAMPARTQVANARDLN